jgi:ADP-dependent NAD(P)H-hydrate dehydratase / NAD(P)H-hydrate epimerase
MSLLSQMTPVLCAASMRRADQITIEQIGIPGFTLMESAGREAAEVAQEMIEVICGSESDADLGWSGRDWTEKDTLAIPAPSAHIVCLCGKGNNGGDGLVMARYLSGYGHQVTVLLFAQKAEYSGDAALNLGILEKVAEKQSISITTFSDISSLSALPPSDLVIDALVGTGLNSTIRQPLSDVISWVNAQTAPVLSVDIPSGLSSDSGKVLGAAVHAHVTVTLASLKPGLLIEDGPDYVGALHVVDIGIPPFVIDSNCQGADEIRVSNVSFVRSCLPEKTRKDHKYSHGPTLVVAGSATFPGAPVLASLAAAKVGSGYVVCMGPANIRTLLEEKLTEITVESWETSSDSAALQDLIDRLDSRWKKAKSMLVGPGLGRDKNVTQLVKFMLTSFPGPSVVDADALYALRNEQEWVRANSFGRWIFTPHDGEYARLQGSEAKNPDMRQDRIEAARVLAKEWNVIVLLKGQPSIVANPTGQVVINPTGNPSVGTAGSGDVLSGIIAGLLAQGVAPFQSAICGIHIAGTTADLFVEEHASGTLMAGDIVQLLPRAMALYR